ncbi:alpha-tubulin N-acetyltransferase 2 [Drosophila gunungcola]|uniref:Alpha-tubulin N-acetyltransferase n=1 Tax=Drosophila gunungcola TaxID=103775 RepID=A0A9P9YDA2_9MUSC|nr:alpha-tubulin N-acetyltransferase 2 [Drosophila gunungcola]KAI8034448.1 hypothetical protein M5D96_012811 [Drosophila gunungcola]
MEFAFDIQNLFPQTIISVQAHNLQVVAPQQPHRGIQSQQRAVPPSCRLSQILDLMGQRSAVAQKLNHPVTSAEKLVDTDHVVYLKADSDGASGRWAVSGLLKVGTKDLYLFDKEGCCRRADRTPAILDFYVTESRQRRGVGKQLFQRMLDDQGWTACKCSVDRPSDKMLAFLSKHYGLVRTIPQGNNFVIYEGFFDDAKAAKDAKDAKDTSACLSRGH